MRFLLWDISRHQSTRTTFTRVRIELKQEPTSYSFVWTVDPATKGKRLSKKELHELDMRVAKHVTTLNLTPTEKLVESTIFVSL